MLQTLRAGDNVIPRCSASHRPCAAPTVVDWGRGARGRGPCAPCKNTPAANGMLERIVDAVAARIVDSTTSAPHSFPLISRRRPRCSRQVSLVVRVASSAHCTEQILLKESLFCVRTRMQKSNFVVLYILFIGTVQIISSTKIIYFQFPLRIHSCPKNNILHLCSCSWLSPSSALLLLLLPETKLVLNLAARLCVRPVLAVCICACRHRRKGTDTLSL